MKSEAQEAATQRYATGSAAELLVALVGADSNEQRVSFSFLKGTQPQVRRTMDVSLSTFLHGLAHMAELQTIPAFDSKNEAYNAAKLGLFALSPATFRGAYAKNENAERVSYLMFDADEAAGSIDQVCGALATRGLSFVAYSSTADGMDGQEANRLIVFADASWTGSEHEHIHRAAWRRLELGPLVKDAQHDAKRIGFTPAKRGDRPVQFRWSVGGAPLSLASLRQPTPPSTALARVPAPAPNSDVITREHAERQAKALARKTAVHTQEECAVWRKIAAGTALCERGNQAAHNTLLFVTAMIARAYPDAAPESVAEVLSPTWPENERTEVINAFTGAVERLHEEQAQRAEALAGVDDDLLRGDRGQILATPANVLKIVRGRFRERMRVNVRSLDIECMDLPWDPGSAWRTWREADYSRCSEWLQCTHGVCVTAESTHTAVATTADANRFDPFRAYLEALPHWDGVQRAPYWLRDTFNAADSRYLRAVSLRWLLALVARTLEPGCKVDTKLVLVGAQGLGKSQALSIIAGGPGFHMDSAGDDREPYRDMLLRMHRAVIVEDQEMTQFSRRDVSRDKAFLSTRVDTLRPPYARLPVDLPRRFVVAGTANPVAGIGILRDDTGGRRFWVVECVQPGDLERLRTNRDQTFAEALHLFRSGEQWWLTEAEEQDAREIQTEHTEQDPWAEELLSKLSEVARDQRPIEITVAGALAWIGILRPSRADSTRMGGVLRAAGFAYLGRKQGHAGKCSFYSVPLPAAEVLS